MNPLLALDSKFGVGYNIMPRMHGQGGKKGKSDIDVLHDTCLSKQSDFEADFEAMNT